MKWLAPLIMILPLTAFASVGSITDLKGPPAQLERSKKKITAEKGTGVQMNDTISTARSSLGITFEDKTKVRITEQSRLVIDDFVYDPKNKDASRMGMKVALGTVRYASGQVAKNNPQKVAIKTPTASIAVRGTDFTMTVDETGKSLVILLPSCPENAKSDKDCIVGEIEVATDVGAVILNQAYQATVAASANQPPTQPKLLDINENLINNLLIVSPPRELVKDSDNRDDGANKSGLDRDFLEYRALTKNFLEENFFKTSELDINNLDINYLDNILDLEARALSADELEVDPVLPNIRRSPWVQAVYNEETIFLRSDRSPHLAEIRTERGTNGTAIISQDGVTADIQLNAGGTNVVFNIKQTQ
jgi:hypothetical protein